MHPAHVCGQHWCDWAVIGHQAGLQHLNGVVGAGMRLGRRPPVILQRLAGNKSIVFSTLDSQLPVRFDHSPCEERRTAGGPFFLLLASPRNLGQH